MNNRDLLHSNRFVPGFDNSRHHPTQKRTNNVKFNNNTVNSATNQRTDNTGLNNSVKYNTYINDGTYVVIDSRNRDTREYPIPNNYFIELNQTLSNIKEIKLVDININGMIAPLSTNSNKLIWEYPTIEDVNLIEPIPPGNNELTVNKVALAGYLNEGFYNVQGTKTQFENELSKILHDNEFRSSTVGAAHHFDLYINPMTHYVYIVNRLEEIKIAAIQVLVTDNVGQDVFNSFSDMPGQDLSCNNGYYIVIDTLYNDNEGFPLVITNYDNENIANLPYDINYQLAWGVDLNTNEPHQFMFIDTLTIGGNTYYRYKIFGGQRVYLNNINMIYNMDVEKTLENAGIAGWLMGVSMPVIGRSIPFRFIYKRSQINQDVCKLEPLNVDGSMNTVLSVLGWDVQNDFIGGVDPCFVPLLVGDEQGPIELPYKYIHVNADSFITDGFANLIVPGTFPPKLLNIENVNNQYWFRSEDYIFLKLNLLEQQQEIGSQIIQAGLINVNYNENSLNQLYLNPDINAPNSKKLQRKNLNNIFAKIDLNILPGNIIASVQDFIANELNFKNEQLTELTKIGIQFVDREGRILNMRGNHHFTLLFTTKRNVVENILFNTRNG